MFTEPIALNLEVIQPVSHALTQTAPEANDPKSMSTRAGIDSPHSTRSVVTPSLEDAYRKLRELATLQSATQEKQMQNGFAWYLRESYPEIYQELLTQEGDFARVANRLARIFGSGGWRTREHLISFIRELSTKLGYSFISEEQWLRLFVGLPVNLSSHYRHRIPSQIRLGNGVMILIRCYENGNQIVITIDQ